MPAWLKTCGSAARSALTGAQQRDHPQTGAAPPSAHATQYVTLGCSCWFTGTATCPTSQPAFCRNCTKDWPKPLVTGTNRVPKVCRCMSRTFPCLRLRQPAGLQGYQHMLAHACCCTAAATFAATGGLAASLGMHGWSHRSPQIYPCAPGRHAPLSLSSPQNALASALFWNTLTFRAYDPLFKAIASNTGGAATAFYYSHHTWWVQGSLLVRAADMTHVALPRQACRQLGQHPALLIPLHSLGMCVPPSQCAERAFTYCAVRSHQNLDNATFYDADMQLALNKAMAGLVSREHTVAPVVQHGPVAQVKGPLIRQYCPVWHHSC